MADREKIIKGLKLCVVTGDFCGECPYDGMESCIEKLHDDTISMLKEKEERIELLENQLETLTIWRMNDGAFD